jgi:hypothetical protein
MNKLPAAFRNAISGALVFLLGGASIDRAPDILVLPIRYVHGQDPKEHFRYEEVREIIESVAADFRIDDGAVSGALDLLTKYNKANYGANSVYEYAIPADYEYCTSIMTRDNKKMANQSLVKYGQGEKASFTLSLNQERGSVTIEARASRSSLTKGVNYIIRDINVILVRKKEAHKYSGYCTPLGLFNGVQIIFRMEPDRYLTHDCTVRGDRFVGHNCRG